jgi:Pirin C-terminal cupin domain
MRRSSVRIRPQAPDLLVRALGGVAQHTVPTAAPASPLGRDSHTFSTGSREREEAGCRLLEGCRQVGGRGYDHRLHGSDRALFAVFAGSADGDQPRAWVMVYRGEPIGQPVVMGGPFV